MREYVIMRLSSLTLQPFAGPSLVAKAGRSLSKNAEPLNDLFQCRAPEARLTAMLGKADTGLGLSRAKRRGNKGCTMPNTVHPFRIRLRRAFQKFTRAPTLKFPPVTPLEVYTPPRTKAPSLFDASCISSPPATSMVFAKPVVIVGIALEPKTKSVCSVFEELWIPNTPR